ncbi:MAG: hypothetical protein N2745_08795 [Syntrophorhabdaceae bacterium]|nr:hypothetical protein [Syntrophorhabdaceae bacterium]
MVKKGQRKKGKKEKKETHRITKKGSNRMDRIKGIGFISVALLMFAYMVYAGGTLTGFLSLIVGLVCGLFGFLYLFGGKKR